MIYNIDELTENPTTTNINNNWVMARPINYKCRSFKTKLKEAWMVFIGKLCFLM